MNTVKKFVESFEELQALREDGKDVYLQNAGPFGSDTYEKNPERCCC